MQNGIGELLDIFLVTFNRAKELEKTFSQIFAEDSPIKDYEITIIDNDSTDNTKEIVQNYQTNYPNLKYMKNNRNIGGNANIMKGFVSANKKYVWVLADNDTFCWDSWNEVVEAINNDVAAIYVSKHDMPELNIAQRFIQSTFVPGVIYKTELLTPEVIASMAHNISNLFPHLALSAEVFNKKLSYKIVSKNIVVVGKNINEVAGDDYTRGYKAKETSAPVKKMNWLTGYANSLLFIKDSKLRNFLATHNHFFIGPLNSCQAIFYNEEFSGGNRYNLFCMYNALNFVHKLQFLMNLILCLTIFRIVYIYKCYENPLNDEYYFVKFRIRLLGRFKTNLAKFKIKLNKKRV